MASYLAAPSIENPLRSLLIHPLTQKHGEKVQLSQREKNLGSRDFQRSRLSYHKGTGGGDLRANDGIQKIEGGRQTPQQLTITSNTRKSSEVTDSRKERSFCQAKKSLTQKVFHALPSTRMGKGRGGSGGKNVGVDRAFGVELGCDLGQMFWSWFLILLLVYALKRVLHLNVFFITLSCFDWIPRCCPQGMFWERAQNSYSGSSSPDY